MLRPDPMMFTLEEWAKGFHKVYADNDDQKNYSALWLPATSHASTVAEAVRLNDYGGIIYNLGNVFAWALSFAERYRLDLIEASGKEKATRQFGSNWTEWILFKYPNVCATCGQRPCVCCSVRDITELRRDEKKEEYGTLRGKRHEGIAKGFKQVFKESRIYQTITMPKLFEMFNSIYAGTMWGASLSDVAYHFLEEVGEVAKEITFMEVICGPQTRDSWKDRLKTDPQIGWEEYSLVSMGLMQELADVFSWISALCFKVSQFTAKWKPNESLIQLYTGRIPDKHGNPRHSVLVGDDKHTFVCRYCLKEECSSDCVQTQIQKRVEEGNTELNEKFNYGLVAS